MSRILHRLAGDATLPVSYLADGPEMAKQMVADRLGVTLLSDFNVLADPLERRGVTCRPLSGEHREILLVVQRRRARFAPQQARDLHAIFVERAQAFAETRRRRRGRTVGSAETLVEDKRPDRIGSFASRGDRI
jgi:DNA-binding transcriptional LysR family regulator